MIPQRASCLDPLPTVFALVSQGEMLGLHVSGDDDALVSGKGAYAAKEV